MTQAITLRPALDPKQQDGESFDAYLERIKIYTSYNPFIGSQRDPETAELLEELTAVYGSNRANRQAALLRELLKAIAQQDPDVDTVSMEYEGSGDSGQIESIDVLCDDEPSGLDSHALLNDILDIICWDIAYGRHPGFEINDGGRGELRCTKQDDGTWEIELNYHEYYTSSTNYTHSF